VGMFEGGPHLMFRVSLRNVRLCFKQIVMPLILKKDSRINEMLRFVRRGRLHPCVYTGNRLKSFLVHHYDGFCDKTGKTKVVKLNLSNIHYIRSCSPNKISYSL